MSEFSTTWRSGVGSSSSGQMNPFVLNSSMKFTIPSLFFNGSLHWVLSTCRVMLMLLGLPPHFSLISRCGSRVNGNSHQVFFCTVSTRGVQNMDMSKFCLAHKQIWFPKVPPFQKYQNYLSSVMISAASRIGISRDRGVSGNQKFVFTGFIFSCLHLECWHQALRSSLSWFIQILGI